MWWHSSTTTSPYPTRNPPSPPVATLDPQGLDGPRRTRSGPDPVALPAGVMEDKRASRGALVTTSWFGKATEDFVGRHGRIQLIDGAELNHLLAEHLNIDAVIGPLN